MSPRKTPFGDRLRDSLLGLVVKAEHDPVILEILAAVDRADEIAMQQGLNFDGFATAALADLEAGIQGRNLGGFAGANWLARVLFEGWVMAKLVACGLSQEQALQEAAARFGPYKIEHFAEGNAIRALPDGSIDISTVPTAELVRQTAQYAEYRRLFEPAARRGRPPGRQAHPGSGRPGKVANPHQAAADAQGLSYVTWGRHHRPDLDPSEPKQRRALYQAWDRARFNGHPDREKSRNKMT